jgi:glycerophosphoryl diester phosphodiesterase
MRYKPLLLGHRGARASADVAENTLSSFDLALDHGCDGFEFDVRLSADGAALICHDPKHQGITIAKALSSKLPKLPTLRQVLMLFANRAFLDIELKVPGIDSELMLALQEYRPERGYVVSSFLPQALMALAARSGSIPLGFICDDAKQLPRWRDLPISYLMPHFSLITENLVSELRQREVNVLAWTVNDPATMLRLAKWGVQGIISDDTETLVKTFG